jgi:DNA-binding SARP family transcriptional activator
MCSNARGGANSVNAQSIGVSVVQGGSTAAFRLRCLGDLRICAANGADCTPRGRKTRALLTYVLLGGGGTMGRDRLATLLWGDRGEEQARASLRQALYELRHLSSGPAPLLSVTREHVTANVSTISIDLEEVESFARTGDLAALAELLPRQQLVLLADLDDITADFDDWLRSERTQRTDRLIAACVTAGHAALSRSDALGRSEVEPVRALAAALEMLDPLSEPVVRLGIQADLLMGDPTNAHRRYRRFADRLKRELATKPSAETRALLPRHSAEPEEVSALEEPGAGEAERPMAAPPSAAANATLHEANGVAASQSASIAAAPGRESTPQPPTFASRFWQSRFKLTIASILSALALVAVAAGYSLLGSDAGTPRSAVQQRFEQAQSLIRDRNEPDLNRARTLLLEAVELDPHHAPAWASLSIVTMLLSDEPQTYGPIPQAQARSQALHYANRALELDPQLAAAHAALGLLSLNDARSIPHYQRAIALDPQRGEYHRWLGQAYANTGRQQEAMEQFLKSAQAEPLWNPTAVQLISHLAFMNREAEIEAVVQRFEAASSDAYDRNVVRLWSYHALGKLHETVALGREMLRQRPANKKAVFMMANLFAALGDRESALAATPTDHVLYRAIINHDVSQVERIARESPSIFWHEELADTRAGELLVASGRGKLLLQLFDTRYGAIGHFMEEASATIAPAPALIVALRDAGRMQEAEELNRAMLERMRSDRAQGAAPHAWAFEYAQQLALAGDSDGALAELERLMQFRWQVLLMPPFVRLPDYVAFRELRFDPRLVALQQRLDGHLQTTRSQIGPL